MNRVHVTSVTMNDGNIKIDAYSSGGHVISMTDGRNLTATIHMTTRELKDLYRALGAALKDIKKGREDVCPNL